MDILERLSDLPINPLALAVMSNIGRVSQAFIVGLTVEVEERETLAFLLRKLLNSRNLPVS